MKNIQCLSKANSTAAINGLESLNGKEKSESKEMSLLNSVFLEKNEVTTTKIIIIYF